MIKRPDEISASNKENLIIKAIFFTKSPSGVILITLIEVKGGDSCGMRETGETSQRTRRGGDGSSLPPAEANRMLVTKALPHDVAHLAFVLHLKRKSAGLFTLKSVENPVFTGHFFILSYLY
ncbi:hypothetical protein [Psychrobacillus psychrodurans]|uniref:Uncharacterized protein n=1 Tax=Psychrobacillus psychrodurans TaxID=126157 RepID=A0A9X3LCH2_9BACI|nr:hypothetical protein [Psychrobacillus psychrodurans]MCZ8535272.1 hypothetical protein [Psychrobacillus psychrodurans]